MKRAESSRPGCATTLLDRCVAAHRSSDPTLSSQHGAAAFAQLESHGCLAAGEPSLAGRSVILWTTNQFAAALAMLELDGLAADLVLTPPDLSADHLGHVAAETGAEVLLFDGAPPAGAPSHLRLVRFDPGRLLVRPAERPRTVTRWILFTSGTSGAPKMVGHTLETLAGAIAPTPPPGAAVWGTFYDIRRYGGLQIFLRSVLGGASMVLSKSGETPADFLARMASGGVTHVSGTPSHWRRALMSGQISVIAPKVVRLSGEIADQAILDALAAAFPDAAIGHAFASTEAGVAFEVTDRLEGFPASLVGGALGAELKILDGSLRIRSPRAANGYVGGCDPPLADEAGFVDTGDLVERRGDRWHFVGRRGGVINVGGLKVNPEEVEAVINRHPLVRMSVVRGRRNAIMGAVVTADVVVEEGAAVGDRVALDDVRGAILAACRSTLPPHKTPAFIRFVPALELGVSGKVSRLDA